MEWFTLGGFSLLKLIDADTGDVVYEEKSQAAESFRPLFSVPGNESKELCRKLWSFVDTSAENNQEVYLCLNGEDIIPVKCFYYPSIDMKQIKMGTGLTGARCHRCPATAADMKNPDLIEEGFPTENNISMLHAIYHNLVDSDGNVKTKKGIIFEDKIA